MEELDSSADPAINFCEISVKKEPDENEDSADIAGSPSKASKLRSNVGKKRGTKRKLNASSESAPKIVQHDLTRRSFECFFCRNKFHGYKTYKTHDCQVKQVRCEVVGCTKVFTMQSGYNNHVQRIHGLPKTGKHFCPCCSICFQMTALKFDEHCAKCVKEKEYKEQPLECDTCKKVFNTLQSFSAHKMFHDTENLPVTISNKDGVPLVPNKKNTEAMCDLCGKTLSNYNSLQKHRHNVHLVNFTGDMYYCDLCPVAKPTRRLLYVHMKSTHIVREHPCEICGKVFRNRELWRKHHLIHNESKRIHLCTLCPHRPGFTFKSALSKHMQQHHGGSHPVRNFVCDVYGCNAAYSLDYLLAKHKSSQHGIMYSNHNHNIPY
jgi:Zinc finger, C2H2 type